MWKPKAIYPSELLYKLIETEGQHDELARIEIAQAVDLLAGERVNSTPEVLVNYCKELEKAAQNMQAKLLTITSFK